ncbi:MAG: NADH-dependent [FeFe] hydrogenase, group A6 [Candidatus Neomarinimicrobiota bacterium]|jgi:iron-only hydrogenase group A|nr:NADH-dependent [FeFe] hydrogenase, group A6 [Candidatus Neomarinimicrobiota bacterium]MDD3965639.1 NADH-dependent [FeFe] hydrogenase, group A6 [Candidatus Neomarinimicrobiota bacterium]MDD4961379.1 NADH-dependent [FeFe] hydrogenase, group A6 [Candidatus Neomarinimicrobiota bacterium]MDD5709473.1 NADH-dependent [FeFe] hydrogenase, group A6 [Candidatus Neomarinimicrobiota bacterium]MDX9780222.1 NADH-dependent [FeFe] hydrogenase, group A6 [bacterium]
MNIKINNNAYWANPGETILQVTQREGIKIPTLCYMSDLTPTGACRICVVEIETGQLVPACAFPVYNGMEVQTNSKKVRRSRKSIIELLIANHPQDCLVCVRNGNCDLQDLAAEYGVRSYRYVGEKRSGKLDLASPAVERDPEKCILCGRCVRMCHEVQNVGAIDFVNRGFYSQVSPAMDRSLNTTACVYCGQCVVACPVGALREKSYLKVAWEAINDPEIHVIAQVAPAVRVAIGEEFGLPPGTITIGKIPAALRRIGVNEIFDTNFAADLTIMEEANELIERIQSGGKLPLFTSCSPGWIKYVEHFYPELLEYVSTCKSPQGMQGAMIKSYYAKKTGLDPKKIFVLSIMPCTAKKFEAGRPELSVSHTDPDVDVVLSTREFARMLKIAGIDFNRMPEEGFDDPLGESTGAGVIFGASGGVLEAALRTAHYMITGKDMDQIDFTSVRGLQGVKESSIKIGNATLKVAAVSGLHNIDRFLEEVRNGNSEYHFIEVMACPGGCINGGGQPLPSSPEKIKKRMEAIYEIDRSLPKRCSHYNDSVKALYDNFLGKPGSKKSHELLHTHYMKRESI